MFSFKDKIMEVQRRYLFLCDMISNVLSVVKRVLFQVGVPKHAVMADGTVTDDTRTLGYEMCRDSIGGVWAEIGKEELQITRLSGGLTNYLYICKLPSHVRAPDNQPTTVLLRVYGSIATASSFVVQNSVVFALMSEKKLGPKLYGMNPQARIEEYIPTRCLATKDLQDVTLSRMIAHKLALFHALDMPICKEPRFLNDTMDKWAKEVEESLRKNKSSKDAQYVNKFKSYNLTEELATLKTILKNVTSPVVFSHNDLQEGNVLYMQNCLDPKQTLTVIDWEYCSYNYRGHDLGNHFMEWCYDYSVDTSPYYSYTPENYPSVDQQFAFFREYLETSGKDVNVTVLQDMYVEANTHALASHFFWGLWSILQNDMSDIEFGFMEYAECRLDSYFNHKRTLPSLRSQCATNIP